MKLKTRATKVFYYKEIKLLRRLARQCGNTRLANPLHTMCELIRSETDTPNEGCFIIEFTISECQEIFKMLLDYINTDAVKFKDNDTFYQLCCDFSLVEVFEDALFFDDCFDDEDEYDEEDEYDDEDDEENRD